MKRALCWLFGVICLAVVPLGAVTARAAEWESAPARYSAEYRSDIEVGTETKTVYYDTKKIDEYVNTYETPTFTCALDGSCVVEAGGNVIAYYDRLYDELIPGYRHQMIWGQFSYGSQNQAINDMFTELSGLMDWHVGVTVDGFQEGMDAYVSGKGRTFECEKATGAMYNTNLYYLKEKLREDKLAVVFCSDFALTPLGGIQKGDGYETISYLLYKAYHAMVVYGYYDVNYYLDGNFVGQDTYLYCGTGFTDKKALMNIDDYSTIEDIYIVNIV